MTEQSGPNVGQMIRTLREQRGLSLRALAKRSGLSVNAISRIEHGDNSPTVSSLHLLATGLTVPITAFFDEAHEQATVFVPQNQRLRSEGDGVVIESLGIGLRHQHLEPFMMTVSPQRGNIHEPIVHPGQEFVFLLQGELEYRVGDQTFTFNEGDSLLFEATQPHCFYNPGSQPAIVLLVFQTIEGTFVARQQHMDVCEA
ncbi:MAG: helix-turn-helix transcriptional regulator [Anaerolineae bacterium]|nr:helix-turn-helix transcriptional regulator [Anaerolineae bacterium]